MSALERCENAVYLNDPGEKTRAEGWTPLLVAANQNHSESVNTLLALGADPKVVGKDGKSYAQLKDLASEAQAAELEEMWSNR